MLEMIWGATAMGCLTAGAFFLRFFRQSRDRLFLVFALAFWTLAVNWVGLVATVPTNESRKVIYFVRFLAFLLLLVGIVDKNRKPSS